MGRGSRHADRDARHARLDGLHVAMAPELLNYFARRVIPVDDAADLLAETFLAAWRHITRLPVAEEEARMWTYGIARNVLRNWTRGQHRQHDLGKELRGQLARTGGDVAPVDAAIAHRRDVQEALASLPANQRELVMFIHWDGFTLPQAAQLVKCSESTARGRYQRATIRLRERLADYDTRVLAGRKATP
jgi:RNA polymerase sigma-70 factor (ECF subfamily)